MENLEDLWCDLPIELVHTQIAEKISASGRLEDLKSMRLVCRSWSTITLPHVVLTTENASVLKQMNIAKRLVSYVRCVPGSFGSIIQVIKSNKSFNKFDIVSPHKPLTPVLATQLSSALVSSQNLSELSLSECDISKESWSYIESAITASKNLVSLRFQKNNLTDEMICRVANIIKTHQNLSQLDLFQSANTIKAASALADAIPDSALTKLRLFFSMRRQDCTKLASALAQSKKITFLDLKAFFNNASGALEVLLESLKQPTSPVVHLILSQNNLQHVRSGVFGEIMEANRSLESLDLESCNLSSAQVDSLASGLARNSSLKQLILGANPSCGFKSSYVMKMCRNTTLRCLDLSNCALHTPFYGKFFGASQMGLHSSITQLSLGGGFVSHSSAIRIGRFLESNPPIISLRLDYCCIGASGMAAILEPLRKNKVLQNLSLAMNSLSGSSRGIAALIEVAHKTNISYINVCFTNIITQDAIFIANSVKSVKRRLTIQMTSSEISAEGDEVIRLCSNEFVEFKTKCDDLPLPISPYRYFNFSNF